MKTYMALAMVFLAGTVVWAEASGGEESSFARVVFYVR
jgi:hypothetical protein